MFRSVAVMLVIVLAPPAVADTTYSFNVGPKQYTVTILRAAVEKAPAWKADADDPPLSARKALRAAAAALAQLVPERRDENWKLAALELTPVDGGWVWTAAYKPLILVATPRSHFRLTVLMDGTVIDPVVMDRKPGK